jgi:hypothetical protein
MSVLKQLNLIITKSKIYKLPLNRFLLLSLAGLWLSDFLNVIYLQESFVKEKKTVSFSISQLSEQWGAPLLPFSPHSVEFEEFFQVIILTLNFVLVLLGVIQTIIYLLAWKQKQWALRYVKNYSLIGLILTLTMIPTQIIHGEIFWTIISLILCPLYFLIYYSFRLKFKFEQTHQ